MTSSRHPMARLALLLSAAVFAAGCGEAVVGGSELRNTAPTLGTFTDLTTDEDTLVTGSFTVADAEDLATLTFTVTSSDPAVVSSAGVVITGSGTDRTISILPEANASGLAVITVLVSDGEYSATGTFTITVLPINDPPVIAPIANESTTEELPVGPIRITVTDIDSPLGDLTLTAVSGDLGIVDAAGVMVAGSAGAFTVTLSPLPDAFGEVVITVTASDGAASSVASFTLTVTNVNDAPTITALTDLTTDEDTATAALPFTIADVDTPVGDLLVTVVSDNATLLPPASFMLGGSGASRTLTILPATQQNGSGTVTVTVSDGSLSGSTSFVLTVTAVDDAPEIMGVTNVTVMEDPAAVPTLAFTVVDVDTPAPTVTATSDNPALVPSGALTIVNGGGNAYTLSLPPLPNAFGMATIVITANDGVNAPVTSSFVFTVTPVNDAPVLTAVIPNRSTNEDTPLSFSYGISEIDDNLDTQVTYALELVSGSATLFPAANIVLGGAGVLRTVQLTPALNQNGVVRFRIVATDSGGSTPTVLTVSQEFDITVVAINDAPTIVPSAPVPNPLFAEERSFGAPPNIGPLTFTIADVETPLGSLTITAARANGTVIDTVTFVAQGGGVFELGGVQLGLHLGQRDHHHHRDRQRCRGCHGQRPVHVRHPRQRGPGQRPARVRQLQRVSHGRRHRGHRLGRALRGVRHRQRAAGRLPRLGRLGRVHAHGHHAGHPRLVQRGVHRPRRPEPGAVGAHAQPGAQRQRLHADHVRGARPARRLGPALARHRHVHLQRGGHQRRTHHRQRHQRHHGRGHGRQRGAELQCQRHRRRAEHAGGHGLVLAPGAGDQRQPGPHL
ncbi:MAG: tandem-95 repeat protein [Sandaracinaceae bacterium]|nr:tandem-95 repeat protein [Sandaracinaceae bacterium]